MSPSRDAALELKRMAAEARRMSSGWCSREAVTLLG
jgi:hypothetical protein